MLAIVGTIPEEDFPLVTGEVTLHNGEISVEGKRAIVNRGTSALLATAVMISTVLGQQAPIANLAGDIGLGDGSRRLYEYLSRNLKQSAFSTITFHYLQPDVAWHKQILSRVDKMAEKPILIADAGFMYAAKISGQAPAYDLFTPDIGELAFLADEAAPHPFYTRGFILHEENRVPELIARAYAHDNASSYVLVKGRQDYVANQEGVQAIIDSHMEEAMEAIGGTGDTLTGIVAVLCEAGMELQEAAMIAARTNRLAGFHARPTPATQVIEIISHMPRALAEVLREMNRGETWVKPRQGKDALFIRK